MPEEFKPGCQRPPIQKPGKQTLKPSPDLVGHVWKVNQAFED